MTLKNNFLTVYNSLSFVRLPGAVFIFDSTSELIACKADKDKNISIVAKHFENNYDKFMNVIKILNEVFPKTNSVLCSGIFSLAELHHIKSIGDDNSLYSNN